MGPLVDHFSLGLTHTAIFVIRILMMPLILYNIGWSVKSFYRLVRGDGSPSYLYESMVFFMSLGICGYHVLAFLGRPSTSGFEPYLLLFLCCFYSASGIAAVGHKLAMTMNFDKFYWLFKGKNLDMALRAAHMNQLDSGYTEGVLEAAETGLAVHLAKKAMNGKST